MIGSLRKRLAFQTRTRTEDGSGGFSASWATSMTLWGSVEPKSARERFFADKTEHNITHKITVRARTDITSEMRITWNGRTFQIRGVRTLEERGRWTELLCEEGVPS